MKPARKLDRSTMKQGSAVHRAKGEREIPGSTSSYRNDAAMEFDNDDDVDYGTVEGLEKLFADMLSDDMEFDPSDCDAQELAREIAERVLH